MRRRWGIALRGSRGFEIEQDSPAAGGTPEMVAKLRRWPQATGAYQGTSTYSANHVRSHRAICLVFTDAN